MKKHGTARVVSNYEDQANLSSSHKARIDKRKAKNKKNTKKFGIAMNDRKNTMRFYETKKERLKKFYEYRKEFPNVKLLPDNFTI